jgi:WD40 repeat protein
MKLYRLKLGFPVHPARSDAERCHAVDSCAAQGFWRNVGVISNGRNKLALCALFSYANHERSSGRLAGAISTRSSVAIAAKQNMVAFAGKNDIYIHDIRTGKQVKQLGQHPELIFALDFTRDGKRLLSAGQNGQAKLWNVDTGTCLMTWELEQWMWTGGFTHNDDFIFIATDDANGDGVVHLMNTVPNPASKKATSSTPP